MLNLNTSFFFLVELVSKFTLIETSFAQQPHGATILSLPSSPPATAPESWIFGAHNVQALRRCGRPRQGLLGALENKTWAWGMSPNLKFHTPANPHTCTEQTHESNGRFLDEPWWPRLLLPKILPFSTVNRNPWKGLTLTRGGRFRWHLSIPQRRSWTCVRRPSTSVPGTGGSLLPSVRATRSDTAAVRLVNIKLGLDSEKRKPTSYPRSLNRETTFGRRNGLHSFHCMSYALYVSRAFRCPPTFLRANFWLIAPIQIAWMLQAVCSPGPLISISTSSVLYFVLFVFFLKTKK